MEVVRGGRHTLLCGVSSCSRGQGGRESVVLVVQGARLTGRIDGKAWVHVLVVVVRPATLVADRMRTRLDQDR